MFGGDLMMEVVLMKLSYLLVLKDRGMVGLEEVKEMMGWSLRGEMMELRVVSFVYLVGVVEEDVVGKIMVVGRFFFNFFYC